MADESEKLHQILKGKLTDRMQTFVIPDVNFNLDNTSVRMK